MALRHNWRRRLVPHGLAACTLSAVLRWSRPDLGTQRRRTAAHAMRHAAGVSSVTLAVPSATTLEVWSFNLRTEFKCAEDGPTGWRKRRQGVARLIQEKRPGLVCVQEATGPMLDYLLSSIGDDAYGAFGTSRNPSFEDETAGMLYDKKQLYLKERAVRWLAPAGWTIGVPAWDAAFPRTLEMGVFGIREWASAPVGHLRVLNTHFDHVGVEARSRSARMIAEEVAAGVKNLPHCAQLICGDFNSPKWNNTAYDELTSAGLTMDAARQAKVQLMAPSTIHKFRGPDFDAEHGDGSVDLRAEENHEAGDERHIDWILWRDGESVEMRPQTFEVLTDKLPSGLYPSDHFPVKSVFSLRPLFEDAAKL